MSKAWSPNEDKILARLGNRENMRKMRATYLNHKTAKQCADRLRNIREYVDGPFAPFECDMIRHLYQKYGPRWGRMSEVLDRSPQTIMERWQTMDQEAAKIRKKMAISRLLS
ncbi:741_t:CDS:2 [Paraglomus occultum]|uniref:741_t:CDS:1 n=1 Tax=Paraglomus occultum TaxID=144539 RepID=A0A9N8WIN4_9GLOM|nr:741_t:CDS:2 [Paraglomus occultum]